MYIHLTCDVIYEIQFRTEATLHQSETFTDEVDRVVYIYF